VVVAEFAAELVTTPLASDTLAELVTIEAVVAELATGVPSSIRRPARPWRCRSPSRWWPRWSPSSPLDLDVLAALVAIALLAAVVAELEPPHA
jgi:hypothetical protein